MVISGRLLLFLKGDSEKFLQDMKNLHFLKATLQTLTTANTFPASSSEKIPASPIEKTQLFYLLLGIHHKYANILGQKVGCFLNFLRV